MKIFLDGTQAGQSYDIGGDIIVEHKITGEDGGIEHGFTQEITFFNEDFDYLKGLFIDDPLGKFNVVEFLLVDDCCGDDRVVFRGVLKGENIDYCTGECFIKVQAEEYTDDVEKANCVQSTLIADNRNGFQQQTHPRMVYCNELRPSLYQDIIMIFGIIINLQYLALAPFIFTVLQIITVVNIIVFVLNLAVDALNAIPGVSIPNVPNINLSGDDQTSNLQVILNLLNDLNSIIVGCGRKHPSPLVRSYIDNVCEICGLDWESQILKNPASDYYNTVLYSAPIEKGTRNEDKTYIVENEPIDTLDTFLDKLGLVFNAEYRVKDGVLTFERKDFFWAGDDWVDYEQLNADNLLETVICYSWRADDVPAFLTIEYSPDAVDWAGNESKRRFSNNIEWNQPFSERQKGKKEVLLPFSTPRFRGDGIDRDVLGDYAWFPGFGNTINQFNDVIIQNNGTNFLPKLLIWDGVNVNFGRVRRYNIPNYILDGELILPSRNFNFPYSANVHNVEPATVYPIEQPNMGIYGRFYSIDNPKVLVDNGKEFTFSFKFNCDQLANFDLTKTIQTPLGVGRMTTATINYTKRTAQIQGKV